MVDPPSRWEWGTVLVLLIVLASVGTWATCAGMAYAAPCDRAHEVTAGDVATCDGVLVPIDEADRAVRCLVSGLPLCEVGLEECQRLAAIQAEESRRVLLASRTRVAALETALDRALATPAELVPWYREPWFVATAAVVVTAAVVGSGVALVYELRR